jgi:hypothetical protein
MSDRRYLCEECGYDATDEAEGDYQDGRWVQLPRDCQDCGAVLSFKWEYPVPRRGEAE